MSPKPPGIIFAAMLPQGQETVCPEGVKATTSSTNCQSTNCWALSWGACTVHCLLTDTSLEIVTLWEKLALSDALRPSTAMPSSALTLEVPVTDVPVV